MTGFPNRMLQPPVDVSEDALRIKREHLKMMFLPEASNDDEVWDNQLRMLVRTFDQLKVKNTQIILDNEKQENRLLVFFTGVEGRPDTATFNFFVKDPITVWQHRIEVNNEKREKTKHWDAYDPLRCATVFLLNQDIYIGALPCAPAKRYDNGDILLEFKYETHARWRY